MSVGCCELLVTGRVQGVGFRPFIARLANLLGVLGWVRNEGSFVRIVAQAEVPVLTQFQTALVQQAPLAASAIIDRITNLAPQNFSTFDIVHSESAQQGHTLAVLPLDLYTCPDCLAELFDPEDRRYRYPFINCTQCGPRYTLIESLPYDRPATSMKLFSLCPRCQQEYENPLDRRYHAEPTACPDCGPQLYWSGHDAADPLAAAIAALKRGEVINVKGVGGFHLMCNALDDAAIEQIRQLKGRPDKPLAVLFAEQPEHVAWYGRYIHTTECSERLLTDVARPIVLCPAQGESLSPRVHPNLAHVGAMLPYTPLHSLLMAELTFPLLVTSANRSKEPISYCDRQIAELNNLPSLSHNRDILYPNDDSVFLASGLPVRLGRGHSPKTLSLPFPVPGPCVALGAEDKITFALARDSQVILGPHLGSLQSPKGQTQAKTTLEHLCQLFQIQDPAFIVDQHPQYQQRRFLTKQKQDVFAEVQHHRAHASALWLDAWQQKALKPEDRLLVFVWDGTGYGDDGNSWGGETFYGRPGQWQRVASLMPFQLPGGDRCIFEPWRVALAMQPDADFCSVPDQKQRSILAMLQARQGCTSSSSAGRLLDACAALLGIETTSFEASAAMQLNDLAKQTDAPVIDLPWQTESDLLRLNWQPLINSLAKKNHDQHQGAAMVFTSLARAITNFIERFKQPVAAVGFSGGVFQSDRLNELLQQHQTNKPFIFHQHFPANDAAISLGQIVEIAGRIYGDKNA